jgi:hypothetical protein
MLSNPVGMNQIGMSAVGTGHHSAMDMHSHQAPRNGQWVNNSNMMNSHSMMQSNISGMTGINHTG